MFDIHLENVGDVAVVQCEGRIVQSDAAFRLRDVIRSQRDCRVVVAGPTTLLALLNSLRMGFRSLAIQHRSSEVWQVLRAVKSEFEKYGEMLDKVQKKLDEASSTIEGVARSRRRIDRRLAGVESMPEGEAGLQLGFDGGSEPAPAED